MDIVSLIYDAEKAISNRTKKSKAKLAKSLSHPKLKTPIKLVKELPRKPVVGMRFTAYGTNSIGTIEKVIGSSNVEYSYSFNPERKFTILYSELRKFAFTIGE